jgi:two-component system, cell cycle sensor histidine kinase and response regulator CckA
VNPGSAAAASPFSDGPQRPGLVPSLVVGVAAILSGIIVWYPTQSAALTGGFVAAGLMAAAALYVLQPRRAGEAVAAVEASDWSLVRSVADNDRRGLAITDRTGRLVCANDLYCDWFGGAVTPPGLPVDAPTAALLAEAGRIAWRDGEAAVAAFRCGNREMTGTVERVGRIGDHLLWRWDEHVARDAVAEAISILGGGAGRALGEAGVMAVVVTAAGTIRTANAAFRLRAGGAIDAAVEGHDFAAALKIDAQGLIRFVNEREGATPLRIIEVPFNAEVPTSPLLLLLVDEDGGAVERGIALDYVESLLAALPFGMAMVNRDGRFLFMNSAFLRGTGVSEGQSPKFPSDLVVSEDMAAIGEAIRRHAGGRVTSGDIGVRLRGRSEDEAVTIGLVGVRGLGDAAVLLTLTGSGDDPTLKQTMVQATKMQAVGQLAGGIAHDFNNILTAILGNCDLMLLRHTPGDSDYDDIQHIRSNANRAANLTRQLLAFSRQQTLRPQILNLSDIVADVSHLLERLLGDNVTLTVQHGRGLGPVRADPVQLEQVIVNLAVNARDAMPRGGTLTISTSAVGAADALPGSDDLVPPGEYSLLTVEDTGSGIPPDILPKIFDPFFTTKEVGKGTGLGLATVYGIVKQSGGFVTADSVPGQGTRFSIYLPVHRGVALVEPERGPAHPAARGVHWGSGTILLVEDEDMVRAVAERAMVRAGYTVITARQGEEGLEKFASHSDIDLVVSDVMMPQMDGPTMVADIRRQRPELPVLFMSGYAEEQLRQSITLPNVSFLAKPFSVAQLVEAVGAIEKAST